MRGRAALAIVLSCAAALVGAAPRGARADTTTRIIADDRAAFEDKVMSLAAEQLAEVQLKLDRTRASLRVPSSLPTSGAFEVTPLWTAAVPSMPLRFSVRAVAPVGAVPRPAPLEVTLAAPLLQAVAVAQRRLHKGSRVSCTDVRVEERRLTNWTQHSLGLPCVLDAHAVALRDLATGDVIRSSDVGSAPAVMAGNAVRVEALAGSITVSAVGIALADAQPGDQVGVRLSRPARVIDGRVIAAGVVRLSEVMP
jgi:flagella basal body P-ring formation protein FlgA